MKATVYFITLPESHINRINIVGWNCEEGEQYLRAKQGKVDDSNRGLFVKAAELDATDAEVVWTKLQNIYDSWANDPEIICFTNKPRSMDVGDIIVWEDGTAEMCDSIGFEKTTF